MITLDRCDFYATTNKTGQFIGRCKQFPDIKTAPRARKIDAIDLAITAVRDRLAEVDDKRTGTKAAPHA
ncbi:hypothetical protein [Mycobacterium sp. PSTR-4-N]|uniref:hypothetical protein n=1 Tax=Mycobacterium sp. PSTR-4-N TaxID=2917745 RepID=UPI001F14FA4C|nr:hypothetical protein [Mycobacterium sp. PSTR-4-N]MCG7592420.1 hypothetical protein [Mycobacterium sp. PSTR-4-N]